MKYQVRFICYQYNSGAGDNGFIHCSRDFDNLEKAERFSKKIQSYLKTRKYKNSRLKKIFDDHFQKYGIHLKNITKAETIFLFDFIYDGYIHSYDGIYGTMENKIE